MLLYNQYLVLSQQNFLTTERFLICKFLNHVMDTRIIAVVALVVTIIAIGIFYISYSGYNLPSKAPIGSGIPQESTHETTISGASTSTIYGTTTYPPCTQHCNQNTNNTLPPCTQNCGQPPPNPTQPCTQNCASTNPMSGKINVTFVNTTYETLAQSNATGWFSDGQNASIMLSGVGFNETGGPLLFNHPAGIASDGQHLVMSDRNNNRILIWNTLPTQPNTPPDIVLGQKNFYSNAPGHGLGGLNWPTQISVGGGKLVVADTENNRILIWNAFPTRNDQPADLEIAWNKSNKGLNLDWPWGVWTNGQKLIVTSTFGSAMLIWNTFPTRNNQSADIVNNASGELGTPRQITSNGNYIMVGDHNPRLLEPPGQYASPGTFVWNTFPTSNSSPISFFLSTPSQFLPSGLDWDRGVILSNDTAILLGSALYIYRTLPSSNSTNPVVTVLAPPGVSVMSNPNAGYSAGDGSDVAFAGGKLYMALYNQNKIVVFNGIPSNDSAAPSFVIGAPNVYNNTLTNHYFITNPVPVTDGNSLFVTSDFDRKMYVYKGLPNQSGAYPNIVYDFSNTNVAPWAASLYNGTLAIGGMFGVYIWHKAPLNGQLPDITLTSVGSSQFKNVRGVAMDSKYFYVSDSGANKIYIWKGVPNNGTNPYIIISMTDPERLSSDGNYLVVTIGANAGPGGSIKIFSVANLSNDSQPLFIMQGNLNLPEDAIVSHGHLFVADTGFNRVLAWNNITDAIAGKNYSVALGCSGSTTYCILNPEIGRNTLFWPGTLAFDGQHLWVGEFKFSGRLLRFDGN